MSYIIQRLDTSLQIFTKHFPGVEGPLKAAEGPTDNAEWLGILADEENIDEIPDEFGFLNF